LENVFTQKPAPILDHPDYVVGEGVDAMCLTFKVVMPSHLTPILEDMSTRAKGCLERMLQDRTLRSSKSYKEIPCVLAKSLISKYQRNKRLKEVKNLVLPICGDKGRQVKLVQGGIRVPALFKKEIIVVSLPKPIIGFIRQVEFFKRGKVWYMSYSYNTLTKPLSKIRGFLGVDRNSVGNVATIADSKTGKVLKLGPSTAGLSYNFRRRRANLQRKKATGALKKLRRKQSRRTRDINHKVSRTIVDYAKIHCSVLVLEDLGKIGKKGKSRRYVQKSQWSFYQLQSFIVYKATLLGIPVVYIDPAYTSQKCSRCKNINKSNGKRYKCSKCGHFDHRDANAAFNISTLGYEFYGRALIDSDIGAGTVGGPHNWRI